MAASPLPLIAVLLMILSPNGRGRSIAFAAGRVLAVLATVLAVAALSDVATQGSGGTRVGAAIRLVLGVVFVVLALSKFRSRPKSEAEQKTPGWMQALDGMKPAKALRTGFLVTAVNPKELIFGIAAGVVIGSSTLPPGMVSAALLIYTGIATITVVGPVVAYLVIGTPVRRSAGTCPDLAGPLLQRHHRGRPRHHRRSHDRQRPRRVVAVPDPPEPPNSPAAAVDRCPAAVWRSRRSVCREMYNGAWHPPSTVEGPDRRRRRARVVKLADTQDLGSCAFGRGGSSPPLRTH